MRAPYRKLLARDGGLSIWRVDGHHVRDHIDVEFTNGAHHYCRPYVPEDEIWLDREAASAGEWPLWALHQRIQREHMKAGAPYLRALQVAEKAEIRARRSQPSPREFRRRRLGSSDGRAVWLVHGRAVRDHSYVHFTLGGHGYVYAFIPRNEIWIDDAVAPAERPAILHHEAVEVVRMTAGGLRYDAAHALASRAETRFRRRAA